ncbi:MAG: hypothetical protein JWR52_1325 [Marmoricola sp.]|nr:hypothetical protein [Marmoricola sp.]
MGRKGSRNKGRNWRRRILMLVLIGLGIAAARAAQARKAAPAPLTVVPTPKPPARAPATKDAVSEPDPVEQLETEAPLIAAEPVDTAVPTETPLAPDDLHDPVVTEFIGADDDAAPAHLGDVPPAPADSLTSFFEEVLTESKTAEAAKTRRRPKDDSTSSD